MWWGRRAECCCPVALCCWSSTETQNAFVAAPQGAQMGVGWRLLVHPSEHSLVCARSGLWQCCCLQLAGTLVCVWFLLKPSIALMINTVSISRNPQQGVSCMGLTGNPPGKRSFWVRTTSDHAEKRWLLIIWHVEPLVPSMEGLSPFSWSAAIVSTFLFCQVNGNPQEIVPGQQRQVLRAADWTGAKWPRATNECAR